MLNTTVATTASTCTVQAPWLTSNCHCVSNKVTVRPVSISSAMAFTRHFHLNEKFNVAI